MGKKSKDVVVVEKIRTLKPKVSKKVKSYAAETKNDLFYSWTTTPTHINSYIRNNLQTIRARSREQYLRNDYVKRYVRMCRNHIVGNGFLLQSQVLDKSGKADTEANDAIEEAYKDFSKKENFSYDGKLSRTSFEKLIVATLAIDGEAVVVKRDGGKYGVQYQLVDAEWLDITHNENLSNGNFVRMGIEYDQSGTVKAYHIIDPRYRITQNVNSSFYNKSLERERIPVNKCFHIFESEFPEQDRGLPWTTTALASLKMLDGWLDAALVNARVGASKLGIITSPTGDGYIGDRNEDEEVIMDGTPGGFEQLPPGYDIKAWQPEYPKGETESFTKTLLRKSSSGLNVNYATLTSDLSEANFSSMRHGAIEEREMWIDKQDLIIENFCMPVYNDWLSRALLRPKIYLVGKSAALRAEDINKYRRVTFIGRRWDWVDPESEMNANELAIKLGIKSRSSIIRKMGNDPIDVGREIESEKDYLGEINADSKVER